MQQMALPNPVSKESQKGTIPQGNENPSPVAPTSRATKHLRFNQQKSTANDGGPAGMAQMPAPKEFPQIGGMTQRATRMS